MLLPLISLSRLKTVLHSSDTSKMFGLDSIPPRILMKCASGAASVLARMFPLLPENQKFHFISGNNHYYSPHRRITVQIL